MALLLALALMVGAYYGLNWLVTRLFGEGEPPPAPGGQAASLPFAPVESIVVGDLTGDGQPERVVLGPVADAFRQIALVTGPEKAPVLIGKAVPVQDFPLSLTDLPRQKGVLVQAGKLPTHGEPQQLPIPGGTAVVAAGGEPSFLAWQPDGTKGLVPVDYYSLAAPMQPPAPSAIVVDKWLNVLWYYEDGKLVQTARVATGEHLSGPAITAGNQDVNLLTPLGTFAISNKQPGLPYYRDQIPALDPRNPLGTRFMGFSVYEGDGAGVWAIHGTNEPDSIGQWVSDGCIRMLNDEVERLYDRVKPDTMLKIISSKPA